MRMKTVLSIDFDGVLHSRDAAYAVDDLKVPVDQMRAAGLFCHCQTLEDLLAWHGGLELVVHSSWRLSCCEDRIRELLGPLGHRLRAVTPTKVQDREASIVSLLKRWHVPRARVVVLDDQAFHFQTLRDCLVVCPSDAGVPAVLSELDAALALASRCDIPSPP
jgi:hypothetical protein